MPRKELPADRMKCPVRGRGLESLGLLASNRHWPFPRIKRKNFRFSHSFVFNDIGVFRCRMARFRGCDAAAGWSLPPPVHRGSNRGEGTPGYPYRNTGDGRGVRKSGAFSQQPALGFSHHKALEFSFFTSLCFQGDRQFLMVK